MEVGKVKLKKILFFMVMALSCCCVTGSVFAMEETISNLAEVEQKPIFFAEIKKPDYCGGKENSLADDRMLIYFSPNYLEKMEFDLVERSEKSCCLMFKPGKKLPIESPVKIKIKQLQIFDENGKMCLINKPYSLKLDDDMHYFYMPAVSELIVDAKLDEKSKQFGNIDCDSDFIIAPGKKYEIKIVLDDIEGLSSENLFLTASFTAEKVDIKPENYDENETDEDSAYRDFVYNKFAHCNKIKRRSMSV